MNPGTMNEKSLSVQWFFFNIERIIIITILGKGEASWWLFLLLALRIQSLFPGCSGRSLKDCHFCRFVEPSKMLPIDTRADYKTGTASRFFDGRFPDYMRRICDFRQMDFEATFDQLLTLISLEPARVYIPFYYRKQTKNQWARDDPAFMVVLTIFVAVAALAYAVAFQHVNVWGYLWAVLYCVVFDWLLVGFAIASTLSHFANKNLRQITSPHSVEQEVEWMYALDVHANAFFCSFLLTYVLQYFLLPLLLGRAVWACVLSNTLYAFATIWYSYITHLGYRALPFLGNTQIFLWYPIVGTVFAWLFSIILLVLGLPVNLTRIIMVFHYA